MIMLSATVRSPELPELRTLTANVRAANREAIAACVQAEVSGNDLASDVEI